MKNPNRSKKRSPHRMYDGYCPKCQELKSDGCRIHDGNHFTDQWECFQCYSVLLYPRKIPMTIAVEDFDPVAYYRSLTEK